MNSRGESGQIVSAHPGIESSGLVPGGLRAIWNRSSATGRRQAARRLLLPVLIGWSMAADLHYSPVRFAAAALVLAAVIARFRWPAPALLLASACLSVAPGAAVVAVLVLAYSAAYRTSSPYRACAAFAAAWALVALSALYRVVDPAGTDSLALAAMVGVSCLAPPAAVGALAGARSRRLTDLRERNEILRQANLFSESQAKMAERARIAGEMHDLIGHRLSLISLHAGALELGTRAAAPQLSEQAVLIRTTAKQALDELRQVLGILAADAGGEGPDLEAGDHADTGTRADVDALVLASRKAGTPVELRWIGDDLTGLDRPVRRAVHRLVREALTNVHKHAPGMPTRVQVERQAETVGVEVGNRLPAPPPTITVTSRTGLGLIRAHERVRLAGGTLTTGPDGDCFVVRALLPVTACAGHPPESGGPSGRRKKAPA
jgi:signal transduction histidine kinase